MVMFQKCKIWGSFPASTLEQFHWGHHFFYHFQALKLKNKSSNVFFLTFYLCFLLRILWNCQLFQKSSFSFATALDFCVFYLHRVSFFWLGRSLFSFVRFIWCKNGCPISFSSKSYVEVVIEMFVCMWRNTR